MENVVNVTAQMKADEKLLEEDYKTWSEICKEIKVLIESNKVMNKEELDEITEKIHESKSKINSTKFETVTKLGLHEKFLKNKQKFNKKLKPIILQNRIC